MSNTIKATHEGKLILGEAELNVAVLEDGTRIISKTAIFKAFGRTQRGRPKGTERVLNMPAFLDANNLQPFVGEDLRGELKQIDFVDKKGGTDSGYNAGILPLLCKVYLDARAQKDNKGKPVLKQSQLPLARASEILLISLSKIGIIAMVDEVTGFQQERDKNALQEFLSKFINEERGVYVPTYPDEFFEALFKMRGLNWSLANKGKKPQYFGHLLNNYVYERIGPKVLEELRRVNPKDEITGKRKAKHTEHIDAKYGHPKLKEHLIVLTAFAKAAGYNWTVWERMVSKALPKFEADGTQVKELGFPEE